MPVIAGATWPGMALYRLARQAAGAAAGSPGCSVRRTIGAAEAQAMGVIDDVAGNAGLALEKAMEVAGAAPGAELAIRRQLMLEAMTTSFEDALGAHLAACDRALRTVVTGAACKWRRVRCEATSRPCAANLPAHGAPCRRRRSERRS